MLRITVLYENHKNPTNSSLEIAHGFSAYLEFEGKKILFDTGWHGSILLNNCKILNVSLKDLDAIIISHAHWDHMGGLTHVLEVTDNPDIYIPDEFSKVQPKEIERYLKEPYVKRMKNFEILTRLSQNIASTGTFKPVGEQALLIKYGKNDETIMIVGCSHPGIASFIESSRKFGDVKVILGGFHGFKDIDYLIKKTNVSNLHMGHCTQHIEKFQNEPTFTTSSVFVGYQLTL
ncbi:MBL fold metallo-hydrolase [Promethearchaeum syntrophicum]|uniref:MBL fold metallo-hydrolase n=1 Tax=Promethearchaeum syntrophicum TaxID=2594042 RepID=A0A5B9D8H3_9ARCH|nr:MBL fold metallo-hydrolase [Candidatus Prometheoarchaeum syntrophicum]QEE15558.1 7,8-dihydropterin-6-methyl-4-(beta-D-ribofuranosyl)-aminobenzene-5'-phosphate synthase [Candidatus Prometheoarchaeum syntrophicum]